MQSQAPIRIGTRGSPLALIQAREVRSRLLAAHPDLGEDDVEIRPITTTGDRVRDRPLMAVGGKGMFTKEIEQALLDGIVDVAVHSMKDMPTELPDGVVIDCLLPREDPRDAFLSPIAAGIDALPRGAVVGSSSLRRQAQLLCRRPDLEVVMFRGNVETRLRKLAEGEVAATLLACAGLNRLGMAGRITAVVPSETMLPAIAQGAIGVERRADDEATAARLAPLNDASTAIAVACERAFLAALDGSCHTPIAGLAVLLKGRLEFHGEILRPDGSERIAASRSGPADDAAALGRDAGEELRRRAPAGFFMQD